MLGVNQWIILTEKRIAFKPVYLAPLKGWALKQNIEREQFLVKFILAYLSAV